MGMRYKYFSGLFTTAALAGALTLSAAPQADNPSYQDPESEMYTESYTGQQPAVMQDQTMTETRTTMSDHHLARKIHKAIARDVTMSNRALDVRIKCKNGECVLKGSVPNQTEKNN